MPMPNVVGTAMLQCSFGAAPSTLVPLPKGVPVTGEGKPAATVMDFVPGVNLLPFGMCMSPSNPTVAAATTAAMGVLTPMPCFPAPLGPWKPGAAQTTVNGSPALTVGSTCNCAWSGLITIINPGTVKTLSG